MQKFLLIFILLLVSFFSYSQSLSMINDNHILDSSKTNKIYLNINNLNFFKNNEFAGEKVSGYTLPGFKLQPKVSFQPFNNILIEGGVHILHYWGANKYPSFAYKDISLWKSNQYQEGLHLLPLFRAQFSIKNNFNIVFGNIYSNNNHNIITPLYNNELNLSADPETGLQLIYNSKYINIDSWINWESFIFKSDNHQEVFTFGLSSLINIINLDKYKLNIYSPLQYIVQHRGGEINSINKNIQTWSNFSFGLGLKYTFSNSNNISFEVHKTGYSQNIGDSLPFNYGFGYFPKIGISLSNFNIKLSYWESTKFISILGSPHFGNISTNTSDLTFDKMKMIYASLDYCYKHKENYSIGFDFDFYYYFPFTGDRPGYDKVVRNDITSFSFGFYLRLNPKARLFTIKD